MYQKIFRKLGSNNIDHKAYWDTPGLPVAHYDLEQVETSDLVILIGTDPTEELPILDLRLKKAVTRKGVDLIVLNDQKTLMDKYASLSLRYHIGADHAAISSLANMLAMELNLETGTEDADVWKVTGIHPDQFSKFAEKAKQAKKLASFIIHRL